MRITANFFWRSSEKTNVLELQGQFSGKRVTVQQPTVLRDRTTSPVVANFFAASASRKLGDTSQIGQGESTGSRSRPPACGAGPLDPFERNGFFTIEVWERR